MKTVRIYTLSDARTPNNIRYVGKTIQTLKRRLQGHICAAKRVIKYNIVHGYCQNWILKVLKENSTIIIEELDSITIEDNSNEWELLEQYWICQLKIWGFNLTNISKGGGGPLEYHPTKEAIEKRASKIKGISRDEETKRKISESHKGKNKSDLHKLHVKEAMTKKFGIPVLQLSKEGEILAEFNSITEAAEFLGKSKGNIAKCCKHEYGFKTAYGYRWEYKNEYIV